MTLKDLKNKIDSLLKSNPALANKKLLIVEPNFIPDADYKDEHYNHYVEASMYFSHIVVTNKKTNETESVIYIIN